MWDFLKNLFSGEGNFWDKLMSAVSKWLGIEEKPVAPPQPDPIQLGQQDPARRNKDQTVAETGRGQEDNTLKKSGGVKAPSITHEDIAITILEEGETRKDFMVEINHKIKPLHEQQTKLQQAGANYFGVFGSDPADFEQTLQVVTLDDETISKGHRLLDMSKVHAWSQSKTDEINEFNDHIGEVYKRVAKYQEAIGDVPAIIQRRNGDIAKFERKIDAAVEKGWITEEQKTDVLTRIEDAKVELVHPSEQAIDNARYAGKMLVGQLGKGAEIDASVTRIIKNMENVGIKYSKDQFKEELTDRNDGKPLTLNAVMVIDGAMKAAQVGIDDIADMPTYEKYMTEYKNALDETTFALLEGTGEKQKSLQYLMNVSNQKIDSINADVQGMIEENIKKQAVENVKTDKLKGGEDVGSENKTPPAERNAGISSNKHKAL